MMDRFNKALQISKDVGDCKKVGLAEIIWACGVIATEAEQLRKERDELAESLDDILHGAFEHGNKNLSGKTLDPDGELLWKAKELVEKIKGE